MSMEELENIIPVRPPMENKNKSKDYHNAGLLLICMPWRVANLLKILIPVGIATIKVPEIK